MKKVIHVKSNGGYLDSETVGMDTIVEDFSRRCLSVWHIIEETKTQTQKQVDLKKEKKKSG